MKNEVIPIEIIFGANDRLFTEMSDDHGDPISGFGYVWIEKIEVEPTLTGGLFRFSLFRTVPNKPRGHGGNFDNPTEPQLLNRLLPLVGNDGIANRKFFRGFMYKDTSTWTEWPGRGQFEMNFTVWDDDFWGRESSEAKIREGLKKILYALGTFTAVDEVGGMINQKLSEILARAVTKDARVSA